MEEILPMTADEENRLAWIHSNRFTVAELFHKKFLPAQTYRNACHLLRRYASLETGFLHMQQETVFQRAEYFLTAGAIRSLDAKSKVLVKSTRYPVKINMVEKEHDLSVQAIRIAFEASEQLKDIFWVTDFEMRSGISPTIKAEFLENKLDKERWRSSGENPNPMGRRTPDGYFEADLDGQRLGFVLEYENKRYSDRKITDMAGHLRDRFPYALKLIVCSTPRNAARMIRALKTKVKSDEQEKWLVSDFEKATTLDFKGIWHQLDQPLEA
jgi:hypothetical protein